MADYEEECRLSLKMKDAFCDDSGKETDSKKAAEIIYKIGLIYRQRSPEKVALIKSAGLFNAAIVRNPSNVDQIKSSLFEICQHILVQANAANQQADLVKKAEEVKISINEFRNEVNEFFNNSVPKTPSNITKTEFHRLTSEKLLLIKQINQRIADRYKQIMAEISKLCQNIMGNPPCEYAVVGMGSLARCEITPYSDFEHIILLNNDAKYKSYLNYFRWFSVIFHVIILNVQETIIPALHISSLNGEDPNLKNWYFDCITPRGISFDGMMPHACKFPLGRDQPTKLKQFTTELIKPINEMLVYLTSDEELKNGYHLADILAKTCFVFGNEDVFTQFAEEAQNYRNKASQSQIITNVQQQVKDDLNSFSTRFRLTELRSQSTINIKQLVYRSTTIFISALARIQNVSANSSFDIITEMADKNSITKSTAEKLQCAVAIACEMRLRVYLNNKSQCDNAIDLKKYGITKFLDIVGAASTINYFQIAYCLQCEVAKQLNFTKLHFYSHSQLINTTIGLAFGMKNLIGFSKDFKKGSWESNSFNFDTCIEELETEIKWNFDLSEKPESSFNLNAEQIKSIADYLYSIDVYDEALEFYKQLQQIYESESEDTNRDLNVSWSNNIIGICLNELNRPADALVYLKQALKIRKNLTLNAEKDGDIAEALNGIGWSHIDMHNYEDALLCLNQTLVIFKNITKNADTDRNVSRTLHNIGSSKINLHNYDIALSYLNQALVIEQNATLDADKDRDLAITHINIARCLIGLQKIDDAWKHLEYSLKVFQDTTQDERIDRRMADTINYMGECLVCKQEFKKAFTCFERAVATYKTITADEKKDAKLAMGLHNLGYCLMKLQDYEKSLDFIKQSLAIYEAFPQNQHISSKIALVNSSQNECLAAQLEKASIGD